MHLKFQQKNCVRKFNNTLASLQGTKKMAIFLEEIQFNHGTRMYVSCHVWRSHGTYGYIPRPRVTNIAPEFYRHCKSTSAYMCLHVCLRLCICVYAEVYVMVCVHKCAWQILHQNCTDCANAWVYACVCICTYVYMLRGMCVVVQVYTGVRVCTCVSIPLHMRTCWGACMYWCICIHVPVFIHVSVSVYQYTCWSACM